MNIPSKPEFHYSSTAPQSTSSNTVPNIPNIPSIPSIPNIPNIPSFSNGSNALPNLPNIPRVNNTSIKDPNKSPIKGVVPLPANPSENSAITQSVTSNNSMNKPTNLNMQMGMNMPMNLAGMPLNMNMMNMSGMPINMNMPMNIPVMPMGIPVGMPGMPIISNNQDNSTSNNNSQTSPDSNYDPALVMKQNQLIQQVNSKAKNRNHFIFEPFLQKEYDLGLDPDRPICEYWKASNGTKCPLGPGECPLKHPSKIFKNKIVCKYWLRGLCKMGDNCDFLHEYNLSKMPECSHYATTGTCQQSGECIYLHADPQSKVPECDNYTNMGFCPDGPNCTKRHVRKVLCQRFLTGFCPLGPDCESTHPKFKIGLLQGRFRFVTDEELIKKRLKDKEDFEAKLRLEKQFGTRPKV